MNEAMKQAVRAATEGWLILIVAFAAFYLAMLAMKGV